MGTATRKRWLCCVALVGLLCVFGLLYLLLGPVWHRVDLDHFRLIARGMTQAEVEAIFGVPPGRYDGAVPDNRLTIDVLVPFPETLEEKIAIDQLAFSGKTMFISSRHGPNPYFKSWFSQHGAFYVAFDQQGRVAATGMWGESIVEPFWQRLWKRLVGK